MALEQTKLARSLAHKLSSQCHDSPGTYKILTNDVRRCRNVLEQLEEGLSEETIDENRRVKVLPIAESANHILQKLDLAIQSYRCSKDPQIDQGIVVAFKSHVQSITDDLTAAYDALTDSAEIAIRFDPRPSLDSAVLEPVSAVSSTNASARDGVRPESLGSSAWSTPVQHDTQSQSSKTELSSMPDAQPDQFEVAAGDGKEVYTSPPVRPSPLLDPNSTRSSQQRGRSPSILSPLYTDPFMSTTLENASSSILCDDETDDVPSSPFDETQPMKPEALERQPSSKGSPSTVKALDVAASPSLPFVSESEPKSESEPESESEPRSEPEPEAESELEPESKPQPESKSESKSESKPESKPRSNSESEPAIGTVEEPSGILENDTADPEIHRREVDAADVEPEFVGPVGSRIQERSTTVRRIVPWPGAGVNIENKSQPQPSSDGSYVDVEDHQPSVQLTSVQDQPKNSTQDAVSAPESPVPEAGDVQQGHGESDLSWEMPLSVLRNQRRWDRFYKSPAAGRLAVANNPTETPGAMSPSPDPRPHAEYQM
ncbi:hypothetical protein K431DRAFT_73855 [Polychaeton citri CBS 116435]|uniref:Uncharacterized protein n=1 Tax=Polychaeton citri CBS 116435 TaxID=1314669 RepID=A0A9P4QAE9_9PEZI|nr:hypothetical protein K431DRAFT_73855 [Polychaeton citri CBS 116435]